MRKKSLNIPTVYVTSAKYPAGKYPAGEYPAVNIPSENIPQIILQSHAQQIL